MNKLPTLLRTRWIDFAASHTADGATLSSCARIELLSNFLAREVDMHVKFDTTIEVSQLHCPRERTHAVSETNSTSRKESNPGLRSKSPRNSNFHQNKQCFCCNKNHVLSLCANFKSMSIEDRWHFIKNNKICYRCLQKGSHSFKLCNRNKNKCEVTECNRRHHTLLHDPNFTPTLLAHTDDRTEPSATTAALSTPTEIVDDSTREVAAHTSAITDPPLVAGTRPTFRPLLKIVAVEVIGPSGSVSTFALLDDGSSSTFIDSEITARIGSTGPEGQIYLDCVGGLSKETMVQYVDFKIKGKHTNETFTVHRARSIRDLGIVCNQSVTRHDLSSYPHLSDLTNELCYQNAKPMLIIGIDNWHLSIATATRKGTKSQPVAIRTGLGWVLFGFPSSRTQPVEVACHVSSRRCCELETLIKNQYMLDSIGITKHEPRSVDDQRALQILQQTARRLPSGRFEVGLLWKDDQPRVPDSFPLALSRFRSLERKMSRDPEYAERYRQNIRDTLSKGYAEECTGLAPASVCWYLPHFGVVNPNKPAKLRVVHDAAAQTKGVSLNSLLLPGPDFLQSLFGILMRFREGKVALTADIREMFPQVKIRKQDRDAQRFLWRDDPTGPIKTYRMSSMIFGACSSPSTAIYITNLNASEFKNEYPEAVKIIERDTYMDDYIGSVMSIERAARLAADITAIHERGGFVMRGWTSNSPQALRLLPKELLSDIHTVDDSVDLGSPHSLMSTRTLGLIWQPKVDMISFTLGLKKHVPMKLTKRDALACVMRVYDPLGILAPVVVAGRILFQNLWRKGLGWDEQLSESDTNIWIEWMNNLKSIRELRLPRCYNSSATEFVELELHVFCDASELAHAAVAYWRFVFANGEVKLSLIASKARVSPLKPVSIPRLELQGALLAARLATSICSSHTWKPARCFFWCDSMTVLGWLRSDARNYKPFVAHRIGEVLELTTVSEWRWIPTESNVADDATRMKPNLSSDSRWVSGPPFLLSSSAWPSEPVTVRDTLIIQEELKPSARSMSLERHTPSSVVVHSDLNYFNHELRLPLPLVANSSRFSSWLRLVRATATAHRFLINLRLRALSKGGRCITNLETADGCLFSFRVSSEPRAHFRQNLTAQDIRRAEVHILRQCQRDSFPNELESLRCNKHIPTQSRLNRLSVFVGDDHLLRLSDRAATAKEEGKRSPIVLDGKHPTVRLLVRHHHIKGAHCNTEAVVNVIRQYYWILNLRSVVRSIAHACTTCRSIRAPPLHPPVGDLPAERLAHHKRPFSFVGIDYFGPLTVAVGRRREKRYVAVMTCLVTRALHLEVVYSLSADAALMCLRRFIARRGTPTRIMSDNGTSFVGANRELRKLYGSAIEDFASNEKIDWKFIPPSAPFMGGAWERVVRSVKSALRVTLRERTPSDEVLLTLLAEAEAIVNSRPLTHVACDPSSEDALTPFHFLIGSLPGPSFPATLEDRDLIGRAAWKKALRLADHFWRRWVLEYLPTLSPRKDEGRPTGLSVGDFVLVADGNLPRGTWPKGKVVATFPGQDGITRVADVRTSAGILRRPLKKLVRL